MDWTITDVDTKTRYTSEQAEAWLRLVVTKPSQRYADDVARLDDELNINPSLQHVGLLNNRDMLVNSELWNGLSDTVKAWLMWVEPSDVPAITDAVINAALARYQEGQ
jgi:hypothetical protein